MRRAGTFVRMPSGFVAAVPAMAALQLDEPPVPPPPAPPEPFPEPPPQADNNPMANRPTETRRALIPSLRWCRRPTVSAIIAEPVSDGSDVDHDAAVPSGPDVRHVADSARDPITSRPTCWDCRPG